MQERRSVVVVRPHDRLSVDMVPRLRLELLRAAADDPATVVCDLRGGVRDRAALAVLPDVARTVRDWPGCPVLVLADGADLDFLASTTDVDGLVLGRSMDDAPEVPAPPSTDRAVIRLQPTLHAPGVARRWFTAVLQGWGRLEDVAVSVLVLDELVTNAVLHAVTDVDITVTRRPTGLALTVADRSADPLVRRTPVPGDEGGHGLVLVDALAGRWGVLPRHPEGKVVWALLG